jgi:hypothetical protein
MPLQQPASASLGLLCDVLGDPYRQGLQVTFLQKRHNESIGITTLLRLGILKIPP